MLFLPLVLAACAKTAAAPASAPSRANEPAAVTSEVSWQRPADVAPLAAEGKFNVIGEAAWPGQKVRVFFFGVQG